MAQATATRPFVQMVRRHFAQSQEYASFGRGEFLPIAEMNPRHARNAAQKLMRECVAWAEAAEIETDDALLWMISTPLHRALVDRAQS